MALERCTDSITGTLPSTPDQSLICKESDRLSTVLIQLLLEHPFWGSLLSQTRIAPDPTLPTYGATDGLDHIWYNPTFTRTLSLGQLAFLLLHEIMHIAFQHFERKRVRDHERWNHACDYAINLLARDARNELRKLQGKHNLELIPGILLDSAYQNLCAEEIYDRLPTTQPQPLPTIALDEHRSFPTDLDSHERLIGKILAAHHQWERQERQGTLPAGLLRAIDELQTSATPWTRILRQWGSRHLGHDEASYAPPHRRRLIRDHIIAPRAFSTRTSMLVLTLDTSGSMSQETITDGLSEIEHLSDLCEEVLILTHDVSVHDVISTKEVTHFWHTIRTQTAHIHGGGGTSHVPLFTWLHEHRIRPDLLISFTDLATVFPTTAPRFPVLWATEPVNANTAVPFGTVLPIAPLASVSR